MGEVGEEKKNTSWLLFVWKICNFCMSLFFALASYVQINDPDAGFWMAGYAVPAVLSACTAFRPSVTETLVWRRVADLHLTVSSAVVVLLGWSLYRERVTSLFQQEEGREFSGLLVALLWLLLCRHSGRAPVGVVRVAAAAAITAFPLLSWCYFLLHRELRSHWPPHCSTAF